MSYNSIFGTTFVLFAGIFFSLKRPYGSIDCNGNYIWVCGRARGTHSKIAEPRSSYYEIGKWPWIEETISRLATPPTHTHEYLYKIYTTLHIIILFSSIPKIINKNTYIIWYMHNDAYALVKNWDFSSPNEHRVICPKPAFLDCMGVREQKKDNGGKSKI